ncbi:hypothetical protein [Mesorhizobium sp.]|uniref:hypothetical protein n=1 Tax=Mesorhizobium sp. TaxID=1871066 RepID=UPI000FE8D4DE|nr:hypothetical protein [Mesorhizobium sp.]RWP54355.1 MAG: hypothetical protein EOR06_10850 [Mesorhizobium sp.]
MSDALIEAEALLGQLPDAVSRRTLGERLGMAIQDLSSANNQMQRMTALIETAELTGFGNQPHQSEALSEMIDCAQMVGEALENAEDAEALREAVFEYSNDLKQAIATLERSIRDNLRTFVNERFQPLIGLGELLTSMNVSNDLGSRLIDCGRQGVSVSNASSAPQLQAAVAAVLDDYDLLQAERARVIGEDEVGDFINALADKRATLAMVTPKVREWLTDHDVLDSLGITIR